MTKLLVEDTSLTTVADAIRKKGGTTGALTFPDGFVSAIEGIKVGENYLPKVVDNSITEITAEMLEGCTKIRDNAFTNCENLTSIEIPDSVTSIGVASFSLCINLTSIEIPDSVTSIGGNLFNGCKKLISTVLSKNITKLNGYTFNNCKSLESMVIPESITSLSYGEFYNCEALTTITFMRTTPPISVGGIFRGCRALTAIKVPSASLDAYKSDTNWSEYADLMVGV